MKANLIDLAKYNHELDFITFRLHRQFCSSLPALFHIQTLSCVGFALGRLFPPDPYVSVSIIMVLDADSIPLHDLPSPAGSTHSSESVILEVSSSPRPLSRNRSSDSVAQSMGRGTDDAEYGLRSDDDSGGTPENILRPMEGNPSERGESKPVTSALQIGGSLVECVGSSSMGPRDQDVIPPPGCRTSSMKYVDLEKASFLEGEGNSNAQDRGKYPELDQNSHKPDTAETPIPRSPVASHLVNSLHSSVGEESLTEMEPQPPELFHAFPEKGWFRSIPLAIGGFLIMTLLVLGNLIYTYQLFVTSANF